MAKLNEPDTHYILRSTLREGQSPTFFTLYLVNLSNRAKTIELKQTLSSSHLQFSFPKAILRKFATERICSTVQIPVKPISLEAFLSLSETKPASEYVDGQISQKPMPRGNTVDCRISLSKSLTRWSSPKI